MTEKYDYITLIGVWEYSGYYPEGEDPYVDMLKSLRKHLKDDGKLIIAIENKLGLKYWNGASEDHAGKVYAGLNDYIEEKRVRTFPKPEIEKILQNVGFESFKFYCPKYSISVSVN